MKVVNHILNHKIAYCATFCVVVIAVLLGALWFRGYQNEQILEDLRSKEDCFTLGEANKWCSSTKHSVVIRVIPFEVRVQGPEKAEVVCLLDQVNTEALEKLLYYYSLDPVNGNNVSADEMKEYLKNDLNDAAWLDYRGNTDAPEPIRFMNWCGADAMLVMKNYQPASAVGDVLYEEIPAGTPVRKRITNLEYALYSETVPSYSDYCYAWLPEAPQPAQVNE